MVKFEYLADVSKIVNVFNLISSQPEAGTDDLGFHIVYCDKMEVLSLECCDKQAERPCNSELAGDLVAVQRVPVCLLPHTPLCVIKPIMCK